MVDTLAPEQAITRAETDNNQETRPASPFKGNPDRSPTPIRDAINRVRAARGEPPISSPRAADLLKLKNQEQIRAIEEEGRDLAIRELRDRNVGLMRQRQIDQAESGLKDTVIHQQRFAVSDAEQRAKELEKLTMIDEKTGLYNEKGVRYALEKIIPEIQRTGGPLSVLFFDLDGFKGVNDKLGHDTGDKILAEVARIFKGYLRESDALARIGGDEFVAIIKAELPVVMARLEAVRESDMPEQVNNSLRRMGKNTEGIRVSTSLGGAEYGPDAKTYDELKKAADEKMYEDKQARKERYKREVA